MKAGEVRKIGGRMYVAAHCGRDDSSPKRQIETACDGCSFNRNPMEKCKNQWINIGTGEGCFTAIDLVWKRLHNEEEEQYKLFLILLAILFAIVVRIISL